MSHILSDEDCTSLLMELEGAGYGFSNTLHEAERFAHKRKIENNHDANTRQMVAPPRQNLQPIWESNLQPPGFKAGVRTTRLTPPSIDPWASEAVN